MSKYVYVTGEERLRRLRAKYKAMVAALMEDIGQLEVERDAATKSLIESEAACDLAIARTRTLQSDLAEANADLGRLKAVLPPTARGEGIVGEGSWSVFAEKMMAERDEARAATKEHHDFVARQCAKLAERAKTAEAERDEARAVARQATDEIGLHAELIEAWKLYQETLAELVEEKNMCAQLRGEAEQAECEKRRAEHDESRRK